MREWTLLPLFYRSERQKEQQFASVTCSSSNSSSNEMDKCFAIHEHSLKTATESEEHVYHPAALRRGATQKCQPQRTTTTNRLDT